MSAVTIDFNGWTGTSVDAVTWGTPVTPTPTGQVGGSLGGSKPRKKIRGPYSDPRIYEAYIRRCIAEREAPRVNVETAILKEALVHEVEERQETENAERDVLLRENQLLERLIAIEKTRRDVAALRARQKQILDQLEHDEVSFLLSVFEEM